MDRGAKVFILNITGTTGDALPVLSLAAALVARGHECHMLGNAPFAEQARRLGIDFVAVAPHQSNEVIDIKHNFGTYLFPSYARVRAFFDRKRFDRNRTWVVNSDNFSPSTAMCELYDLPLCRLYLAPFKLRSMSAPSWPFIRAADGPFGHTFRNYALPRLYRDIDTNEFVLDGINAFRSAWGLAKLASMQDCERFVRFRLALFPEWYSGHPTDWPAPLVLTDFPLPRSPYHAPQTLVDFVDREGFPIVFTPGTGVSDIDGFVAHARACCEELAMPGVVLSPYASTEPSHYGSKVRAFPYIDLEIVLRRAAALVHHGGIGTTARALEAGVPQVISPLAYDQPDNAYRVAKLALGATLPRSDLNGHSLARTVDELRSNAEVNERLAAARVRLSTSNAIETSADLLTSSIA